MGLSNQVLETGEKEKELEKQLETNDVNNGTLNRGEKQQQEDKGVVNPAVILKEIPDGNNKEEMCGLSLIQKEQFSEAVPTKEVQLIGHLMLIESAGKEGIMSGKVQNNWDKSEQSGTRTPLLYCTNAPNSVGEMVADGEGKKIKAKGQQKWRARMQGQQEISSAFEIQAEHIDCFKKRLRNESENILVSLQNGMPKKG